MHPHSVPSTQQSSCCRSLGPFVTGTRPWSHDSSCPSDLSINCHFCLKFFLKFLQKGFENYYAGLNERICSEGTFYMIFLSNEARAIISLNFYSAKRSSHIWGVMRYANIIFFCGGTRMKYNLFCTQISSFLHKMPINWRQKDKG